MSRAQAKKGNALWRVIFDGQSLNNIGIYYIGATGYNTPYPNLLMQHRNLTWRNVAINGTAWSTLATTAATRLHQYAGHAANTVLVMNGGTTDITEGDTGAQVYADEVAYANAARTAGFSHVIACTLVGNGLNTSPQNTARLAHNTLLLADASKAFDAVVDLNATALVDWTNLTYYATDAVHWTRVGAQVCADAVAPALEAILNKPTSTLPATFPVVAA